MRIKVFWLSREDMVRFRHSEYRDFYLTRYTVRSSKVTHPEYFSAPALPTVTDLHHSPVPERLLSVTDLYPERCQLSSSAEAKTLAAGGSAQYSMDFWNNGGCKQEVIRSATFQCKGIDY